MDAATAIDKTEWVNQIRTVTTAGSSTGLTSAGEPKMVLQ